jgi:hypothetical protein
MRRARKEGSAQCKIIFRLVAITLVAIALLGARWEVCYLVTPG